jgi:uncharacterized damage-inducible protein DinB
MIPLNALLLPELESEIAKIRKLIERLPNDREAFKPHEKARSLASLAGHTVDLISFLHAALTLPEFDFGSEHRTPLVMQSREELLQILDDSATRTIASLRDIPQDRLLDDFRFLYNGRVVFSGTRYTAYRINCLDHIIHHRAQLAMHLRLLNLPVPAIFGPSADESY